MADFQHRVIGGCPRRSAIGLALHHAERRPIVEYFTGLDVSMEQTHICIVDRDGTVVHELSVSSSPTTIAVGLAEAPACQGVVFETGRMAPMLYHGLVAHGGLARRSKRLPHTRPIGTTHVAWRNWPAPASSSLCTSSHCPPTPSDPSLPPAKNWSGSGSRWRIRSVDLPWSLASDFLARSVPPSSSGRSAQALAPMVCPPPCEVSLQREMPSSGRW